MAAATSANAGGLHLSGFPRRLTLDAAEFAGAEQGDLQLPDSLAAYAESATLRLPVRRKREGARLRLRLSPSTPPGSYAAQLRVGDKSMPVTIDVAPLPRLRVFPPSAEFVAEAKGTAVVSLTVVNRGNVAIEIPERVAVGLYDDEGLETAFADTYRQDTDEPLKLLGNWVLKLRDGYGGLLRVQVAEGAGALLPGIERRLSLRTTFQDSLKAGHSYHGIWVLGPANYRVNATVRKQGSGA